MANYIKSTNFAIKDGLPTGNPNKIVKGTEIDVEFTAIAGAVASKADINSPTFVGTPAAPTAATGTDTTQIATTEFVNNSIVAERDVEATYTLKTFTSPTINGGVISNANITGGTIGSLSSPIAVPSGGTGRSTLTANNVLLGNGASGVNFVAPGASNNVLTSNGTTWTSVALSTVLQNAGGVVGVGQTWQNVTTSRASNVTYTNTTGSPIVILLFPKNLVLQTITATIDGLSFICHYTVNFNIGTSTTIIVPNNSTYSFQWTSGFGVAGIQAWLELR